MQTAEVLISMHCAGCLAAWGEVRYSRTVRGAVWTQYRCCESAGQAVGRRLSAGGVEWQVSAG